MLKLVAEAALTLTNGNLPSSPFRTQAVLRPPRARVEDYVF